MEQHNKKMKTIIEMVSSLSEEEEQTKKGGHVSKDIASRTRFFYVLIAYTASVGLFLLFYWGLRLNASIGMLIDNTYDKPLYFWPYVLLTLGTIALFGVNIALLTYRIRRFGFPKLRQQAGTGIGSFVGLAASACPMCGSAILSTLGIAGGLAALPFGGLELKTLSFGLMALPIWLILRDMKKMKSLPTDVPPETLSEMSGENTCPVPRDASFQEKDRWWLAGTCALLIIFSALGWNMLVSDPILYVHASLKNQMNSLGTNASTTGYPVYSEVVAKVLPAKGFQSKIVLGDSIVKLVEDGVIDPDKFQAIYKARGGLPDEFKNVLSMSSTKPILLTADNANFYVNLLWPIGLSNYMATNKQSPVNGKNLFGFASTGGWNLGKASNGGAYFNKLDIVNLTAEQEALVTNIAQNSYRPCCNNSTFFQDCNHGSALLGLLELGASQGLTEADLYREALAFNSFWFPPNYIDIGLYFKAVKNIDWENVDPKVVLGKEYSSATGNYQIQADVAKIPNLIPPAPSGGGGSCGT